MVNNDERYRRYLKICCNCFERNWVLYDNKEKDKHSNSIYVCSVQCSNAWLEYENSAQRLQELYERRRKSEKMILKTLESRG